MKIHIEQTAKNLREGGMATVRFDFNGHGIKDSNSD